MSSSLPFDVLQMILETVDDKNTLASCCLASKTILDIAQPLLHRSFEATIRERRGEDSDDDSGGGDSSDESDSYEVSQYSVAYLRTLAQYPRLGAYVHDLTIHGQRRLDRHRYTRTEGPVHFLRRALALATKLKNVTLDSPVLLDDLDSTIRRLQLKGFRLPAFHLVFLGTSSFVPKIRPLKGSYQSLTTDDYFLCQHLELSRAFGSIKTVKFDCSTEYGRFSLSRFRAIQTLELHAVTYQRYNHMMLSPPQKSRILHGSLSHSSTLETVIISGSPCPTLNDILSPSPSGIVATFPPSVATLSINAKVSIATLVNLVQSLPLSTKIKTLKIRSIEGDLTELCKECQKREIRLCSA